MPRCSALLVSLLTRESRHTLRRRSVILRLWFIYIERVYVYYNIHISIFISHHIYQSIDVSCCDLGRSNQGPTRHEDQECLKSGNSTKESLEQDTYYVKCFQERLVDQQGTFVLLGKNALYSNTWWPIIKFDSIWLTVYDLFLWHFWWWHKSHCCLETWGLTANISPPMISPRRANTDAYQNARAKPDIMMGVSNARHTPTTSPFFNAHLYTTSSSLEYLENVGHKL